MFDHQFVRSFICSSIYSFDNLLIFIHLVIDSFNHLLLYIHSLIIYTLIHLFIACSFSSFISSFTLLLVSFIYLIYHLFTDSFNHLFIHPLFPSFLSMLVYSFIGLFTVFFLSDSCLPAYEIHSVYLVLSLVHETNQHFSTSPDTVFVGPLLPRPPAPLSEDLQRFLSNSGEAGIVLVSFGSMLSSPPPEITGKLATALGRLKQKVLWRIDGNPCFFHVLVAKC